MKMLLTLTQTLQRLHKTKHVMVTVLLLLLTPISASNINIENLETQAGFQIIRQSEKSLIQNFSKILHIIDVNDLQTTLNTIESNIDLAFSKTEDTTLINQLTTQIKKVRHNIKTLSLHRHKRGLINLGGNIANWLFGVMDNEDKMEIEEHLKTIDFNNQNIISNNNKQIKINNDLQYNLVVLQKRINESQVLTLRTLNYTTDITEKSIKNIHFLSILNDINILNSEIDKIQQNIVFAKHGIMSRSILTDEEIDEYKIDVLKYKETKCSLVEYKNNLIFAILIPNFTEELGIRYKIISVPNNNFEEIFIEQFNYLQFKNFMYLDNDVVNIKQLKLANKCINNLMNENYNQCEKFIKKNFETIEISPNMILIKNAKDDILINDCNHAKYKLNKNILLTYNNCTIKINNTTFSNTDKIVFNHLVLPNYLKISNIKIKTNIESINLKQIENTKEIEEIKFNSKHNKSINYSLCIISLISVFSIGFIIKIKICKGKELVKGNNSELSEKFEDIQENVQSNNGGVIYPNIPIV